MSSSGPGQQGQHASIPRGYLGLNFGTANSSPSSICRCRSGLSSLQHSGALPTHPAPGTRSDFAVSPRAAALPPPSPLPPPAPARCCAARVPGEGRGELVKEGVLQPAWASPWKLRRCSQALQVAAVFVSTLTSSSWDRVLSRSSPKGRQGSA